MISDQTVPVSRLLASNYNYFRDYDPSIGRYVESDPIGVYGGLNTYGYVGGNPLSAIDRLGLATWVGIGKSIGMGPAGHEEYTLESECKCGLQIRITVEANYLGFGPRSAGAFSSGASYEDNFQCPNPMAFEGPAFSVSATAAFRYGTGFNLSILGRATSPGGWSAQEGLGLGIGIGFGKSKVTSQTVKSCDSCPNKK